MTLEAFFNRELVREFYANGTMHIGLHKITTTYNNVHLVIITEVVGCALNLKDQDTKIFEEDRYAKANTTTEKVKSPILKNPSLEDLVYYNYFNIKKNSLSYGGHLFLSKTHFLPYTTNTSALL